VKSDLEERRDASEPSDVRDRLLLPLLIPIAALVFIGALVFGLSRILLAVSHTGAVVVAIIVAASILAMGALVATSSRVKLGQLVAMLGVVAGAALVTGGVVAATLVEEEAPPERPVVAIAAPPGAQSDGFDPTEVSAPPGVEFVIAFDNQEAGVQHNVALFPPEGTDAEPVFQGELVTGVIAVEYEVPPLEPGEYPFLCEVHPTTMTGTLTAEEGGGGGAPVITASNLAFDKAELLLPPGQETTLTFNNEDSGVPHNVSIYQEEGGEVLFEGETITGQETVEYSIPPIDPGEYYFQCDTHPQMNGVARVG
jgi:plastocyanin